MAEQLAMGEPRVLVFAGSTRVGSVNRRLADACFQSFRSSGIAATLADLREFPMPLYEGDLENEVGTPPGVLAFQKLMREHQALAVASPEYNGSFSALIKNALDWISRPTAGERPLAVFDGKIGAVMSASPGRGGGQRGLRHLRELLEMIGVTVITPQVAIASAGEAFDDEGQLIRPEDRQAMRELVEGVQAALPLQTGLRR